MEVEVEVRAEAEVKVKVEDEVEQIPQIDYDARPLYRVTFPIAYKDQRITAGSLHRLEKIRPETLERLKERGTVAEVQAPPLFVLPGWTRRAARLEKAGITDAMQFLGADVSQTAAYLSVKPRTVQRWKNEVLDWLKAPERRD